MKCILVLMTLSMLFAATPVIISGGREDPWEKSTEEVEDEDEIDDAAND